MKKIKIILQIFVLVVFVFLANVQVEEYTTVSTFANNRVIDLTTMALKLEENIKNDVYSSLETYHGEITGYSADCPLCTGRLACNSKIDLSGGKTNYFDPQYGNVRIVASSSNLPCGSVVRFSLANVSEEPIVAVVLDRGVLGNDLDLLMPSEKDALKYVGRVSRDYDILRFGWTR